MSRTKLLIPNDYATLLSQQFATIGCNYDIRPQLPICAAASHRYSPLTAGRVYRQPPMVEEVETELTRKGRQK